MDSHLGKLNPAGDSPGLELDTKSLLSFKTLNPSMLLERNLIKSSNQQRQDSQQFRNQAKEFQETRNTRKSAQGYSGPSRLQEIACECSQSCCDAFSASANSGFRGSSGCIPMNGFSMKRKVFGMTSSSSEIKHTVRTVTRPAAAPSPSATPQLTTVALPMEDSDSDLDWFEGA